MYALRIFPLLLLLAGDEPVTPSPTPASEITIDLEANSDIDVDREERAHAVSAVTVLDEVSLVGHIERIDDEGNLIVVGRRVAPDFSQLGSGRPSLKTGALVSVRGVGAAHGVVRAETIDVLSERDPSQWSKMMPELVKFKEKLWEEAKRYEDPALEQYLAELVERLLPPFTPTRERRFNVKIISDPDLNAFALPDGDIIVHTGLIARMDNEAQLASVLAHEMAHVTQRHALRAMDKSTEHTLLNWGSLLAAVALGVSGKGDAAEGVQLMSSAWLSGYSRSLEDEADQVGLRYLYLAGYDVREAARVWATFRTLYGDPSREATFFYGSHSSGRDREHQLGHEVWKAYQPSGLIGGRIERATYLQRTAALTRANALLDLERGNIAWARWGLQRSLAIAPNDARTHLGLARLALHGHQRSAVDDARDALEHAVALDPALAEAHRELGYVHRRLGQRDAARSSLERYLELAPDAADVAEIRQALAGL